MITNYLTDIKNNENLKVFLKTLSIDSDCEICGFIRGGRFMQKTNIHPDPKNFFLIDPKECIWENDVVLFHSHPEHVEIKGFSQWDLKNQECFDLDMVVYSVKNNEFYYKEKYD